MYVKSLVIELARNFRAAVPGNSKMGDFTYRGRRVATCLTGDFTYFGDRVGRLLGRSRTSESKQELANGRGNAASRPADGQPTRRPQIIDINGFLGRGSGRSRWRQ